MGLIKYVHPGEVISIMRSKLVANNIKIPNNDIDLVNAYLKILLENDKNKKEGINKKYDSKELFEILKEAYINTYNAYNYQQARAAILALLMNGEARLFTNRYKDRDKIKEFVLGSDIKQIILSNIDVNNLDPNDLVEIVNRFTDTVNDLNIDKVK